MQVRFVILSPNGRQKTVQTRLPILVGRADEARFRIPKDSVSRRHCEFFWKEDAVFVRDLGSTNGTRLDDMQLQGGVAMRVNPGSTVRIAGITMRVEYDAVVRPERTKPPAAGDETVPITGGTAAAGAQTIEALPAEVEETIEAEAVADEAVAEPIEAEAEAEMEAEAAEPVAEAEAAEGGWPVAPAEPAAADDESLNNFFKSLK